MLATFLTFQFCVGYPNQGSLVNHITKFFPANLDFRGMFHRQQLIPSHFLNTIRLTLMAKPIFCFESNFCCCTQQTASKWGASSILGIYTVNV